jgi:hypothetical protein
VWARGNSGSGGSGGSSDGGGGGGSNGNSCQPRVFWLDGMAGTRKSTIVRTIARTCTNDGRLGASFFFSHGSSKL